MIASAQPIRATRFPCMAGRTLLVTESRGEALELVHVRGVGRETGEAGTDELAALPHFGQQLLDLTERRPARFGEEHRELTRIEHVAIERDVDGFGSVE